MSHYRYKLSYIVQFFEYKCMCHIHAKIKNIQTISLYISFHFCCDTYCTLFMYSFSGRMNDITALILLYVCTIMYTTYWNKHMIQNLFVCWFSQAFCWGRHVAELNSLPAVSDEAVQESLLSGRSSISFTHSVQPHDSHCRERFF